MDGRLHRRRGAGLSFFMGGDGVPLLLLHGVPGSAWSWHKVGVKLTSRFRVILPDLMGFGMSDPPAQGATGADQADALRRLLDYLQIDDFYLGGHGFGGAVAVLLMQRHSDLRVRGLTLAASHLLTDQPLAASVGWANLPGLKRVALWMLGGTPLGLRLLHTRLTAHPEEVPWRDFRRHLSSGSVKWTRAVLLQHLLHLRHTLALVEGALPTIACPTLLLWGDDDPLLDVAAAERLRGLLTDALLKVYADTGHFVPEERPLETAEDIVLRFHDDPLPMKPLARETLSAP